MLVSLNNSPFWPWRKCNHEFMSYKMTDWGKKSPRLLSHSLKRFSEENRGAETERGDFWRWWSHPRNMKKQGQREWRLTMFRVFNEDKILFSLSFSRITPYIVSYYSLLKTPSFTKPWVHLVVDPRLSVLVPAWRTMATRILIMEVTLLRSNMMDPMNMNMVILMLMMMIIAMNMEDAVTVTPMLLASHHKLRLAAAARNTAVVSPLHLEQIDFKLPLILVLS